LIVKNPPYEIGLKDIILLKILQEETENQYHIIILFFKFELFYLFILYMLNGITFSIPEEKIVKDIPNKSKLLSSLIPGNLSTYIYNNEEDYYNEYKKSLFATTILKAGWDCMRHYEILLNGCIPYFPNIENCPKNTMKLFPKSNLMGREKITTVY
jgi:hypothetical protein